LAKRIGAKITILAVLPPEPGLPVKQHNVPYWHKADITTVVIYVRFRG